MENTFFCQWFKGFEKGLDEMDLDSRDCLLKHCAKCCADTGVLQSYLKLLYLSPLSFMAHLAIWLVFI